MIGAAIPQEQAGEIMAWISVHQSILGPKLRHMSFLLKCSQWECMGILDSLWLWGLDNAEKDGYIPFASKDDIACALSSTSAGSKVSPAKAVDAMIEAGWIDDTEKGFIIHDWDTWQEQWYKAKERREADAKRKREFRAKVAEQAAEQLLIQEEIETMPPVQTISKEDGNRKAQPEKIGANPKPDEEPKHDGFESFWAVYPRKIGKGEAHKKYTARKNDGFSDEELLTAAKNYAEQCRKQNTDPQYIKHAKTFLSENTPFTDFLPKEPLAKDVFQPDTRNPFADDMDWA